jgi:hypothetical protein
VIEIDPQARQAAEEGAENHRRYAVNSHFQLVRRRLEQEPDRHVGKLADPVGIDMTGVS